MHHFPVISDTFGEINRVLKQNSKLFISDPTPNEDDTDRFVDDYMQMKKDGHIKYYTENEFILLAKGVKMQLIKSFPTEITFPRLRETAIGFDEIMKKHNKKVIDGYNVCLTEDDKYIYITQNVLNLIFEKA